jgi:lipopolysaccharide biosynthesis glycosyltransferase
MDERYKNAFVHKYITNQAYYRFSLGRLLPNLNKIIYLDADTIVFKDLTNFFDLNFKGKIFLGKGLSRNKTLEKQIKINSGVLLLNLKKMRKLDIEKKVLKILNSGFTHPTLHDQAIIEIYLYKYVGLISPEYNSYFLNYTETLNLIRNPKLYNKDELIYSLKYPTIRHYKGDKKNLNDDWFFFARKSKYFSRKTNNYSHVFKISS